MAPTNQTSCKPGFREIICILDPVNSQSDDLVVKQLCFNEPLIGFGDDCVRFRAFETGMVTKTSPSTIGIVKCTYELNSSDWPQAGVEKVQLTFHLAAQLPTGAIVSVDQLRGWIVDGGPQTASVIYDALNMEIVVTYDRASNPAIYSPDKPGLQFLLILKDSAGVPTPYPGLAVSGTGLVVITNITGI